MVIRRKQKESEVKNENELNMIPVREVVKIIKIVQKMEQQGGGRLMSSCISA